MKFRWFGTNVFYGQLITISFFFFFFLLFRFHVQCIFNIKSSCKIHLVQKMVRSLHLLHDQVQLCNASHFDKNGCVFFLQFCMRAFGSNKKKKWASVAIPSIDSLALSLSHFISPFDWFAMLFADKNKLISYIFLHTHYTFITSFLYEMGKTCEYWILLVYCW